MRPEQREQSVTAVGGDQVGPGPATGLDFILFSINEEMIERRHRAAGPPRPSCQGLRKALSLRSCGDPGRRGCVSEGGSEDTECGQTQLLISHNQNPLWSGTKQAAECVPS